jgi:mannosyltransferase OCH1-like enzyme
MPFEKHIFRQLNTGQSNYALADVKQGNVIPRIIHQTYFSRNMSNVFLENINNLKSKTPIGNINFKMMMQFSNSFQLIMGLLFLTITTV